VRTCLLRNAEETEDHGTVYETRTKKMREQIAAMKEISRMPSPEPAANQDAGTARSPCAVTLRLRGHIFGNAPNKPLRG
jgi:hypothetical protein